MGPMAVVVKFSFPDVVITNALVIDAGKALSNVTLVLWTDIVGLGKAGNPDIQEGVTNLVVGPTTMLPGKVDSPLAPWTPIFIYLPPAN